MIRIAYFAAVAALASAAGYARLGIQGDTPKCQGFLVAPSWVVVSYDCIKFNSFDRNAEMPTIAQWSNNKATSVRVRFGDAQYVKTTTDDTAFWTDADNTVLVKNFTYGTDLLKAFVFIGLDAPVTITPMPLRIDYTHPTTTTDLTYYRLKFQDNSQTIVTFTEGHFINPPSDDTGNVTMRINASTPTVIYPSDWSPVLVNEASTLRVAAFVGSNLTQTIPSDVQTTYFGATAVGDALRRMSVCGTGTQEMLPGDTRVKGTMCCNPNGAGGAASCTCAALQQRMTSLQLDITITNDGTLSNCQTSTSTTCPGQGAVSIEFTAFSQSRSLLPSAVLTTALRGTDPGTGSVTVDVMSNQCAFSTSSIADETPNPPPGSAGTPAGGGTPSSSPSTPLMAGVRSKGPCGSTCGGMDRAEGAVEDVGQWECAKVTDVVECPPVPARRSALSLATVGSSSVIRSAVAATAGGARLRQFSANTSYAMVTVAGCSDRSCCERVLGDAACKVSLANFTCQCLSDTITCPPCDTDASSSSKKGLWGLLALLVLIPICIVIIIAIWMYMKRKGGGQGEEGTYDMAGGDVVRATSASAPLYGVEDPYGATPGQVLDDDVAVGIATEAYQPDPMLAS